MPQHELIAPAAESFARVKFPGSFAPIAALPRNRDAEQIAVARYAGNDAAEGAIAAADEWQGYGIGTRLLTELHEIENRI